MTIFAWLAASRVGRARPTLCASTRLSTRMHNQSSRLAPRPKVSNAAHSSEVSAVQLKVIARIRSDFSSKFGIPRQSGLVDELGAFIIFLSVFHVNFSSQSCG